jgi:hypothetical protein
MDNPQLCKPDLTYLHLFYVTFNPFQVPLLNEKMVILDEIGNTGRIAYEFTCLGADIPDQILLSRTVNKEEEESNFESYLNSKSNEEANSFGLSMELEAGYMGASVTAVIHKQDSSIKKIDNNQRNNA